MPNRVEAGIKAITVKQPWAWAIFNGKNIENRTACWTYRGPLVIHAGLRASERGMADPRVRAAMLAGGYDPRDYRWDPRESGAGPGMEYGAVIGVVDLVDCHPDSACCRPWGESAYVEQGGRERRCVTHLVLENPRLFDEPIACRGALGLWTPPSDIIERLREVAHV